MICRYCNRNWGFTQRVMVQLINTLFLSCLFYGSHIWMNTRNMKEINSLFYKIMKSSIGAVFNVKHSICEVILGLPPLHIQNKVNQIKHYLKINLNDVPEDPLKMFIKDHMEINSRNPAELKHALKHVYRFLQWKHREQQWKFTEEDQEIINQRDFSQFHCLSKSACKYTKMLMKKYTEVLWSESLQNEFINEGHSTNQVVHHYH